MKNPSPESYLGGVGRAGEGTVEIGAALTTMIRRTPAACIAWTMARVPCQATPASDAETGPSAEITASAPLDGRLEHRRVGRRQVGSDEMDLSRQLLRVSYDGCDVVTCGDGLLEH